MLAPTRVLCVDEKSRRRYIYRGKFIAPAALTDTEIEEVLVGWSGVHERRLRALLIENGNNPTLVAPETISKVNKVLFTRPIGGKYYRLVGTNWEGQLWHVIPPS